MILRMLENVVIRGLDRLTFRARDRRPDQPEELVLGTVAHPYHPDRSEDARLDVLSFSFFKQVGPGSHTNSHCHPHFSFIGDQVEVRAGGSSNAGTNPAVGASRLGNSERLPLVRCSSLEQAFPNGSKICDRAFLRHRAQK